MTLDPSVPQRIRQLRAEGLSLRAIAKAVSCSYSTVQRYAAEGDPKNPHDTDPFFIVGNRVEKLSLPVDATGGDITWRPVIGAAGYKVSSLGTVRKH